MTNNKKIKTKRERSKTIYRTLEERKNEVHNIIKTLDELNITKEFNPIKELYNVMFEYIRTGDRIIVNIPFPEMKRKIEGILAINVKESVGIRLKHV